MNSSIIRVSDILNNAKKLISSGLSDGYNFDEINALEYFNELLENATCPTPIFSGIIIMEKEDDEYTIIDGLQRLTTINLLLCALCENYKNTTEKNEDSKNKIFNRYLTKQGTPILNLLGEENKIFQRILFSNELSKKDMKSKLYQTYQSFLNEIKEQKIQGTELFRIISKIQFMVIITEKAEVPIRELYQALNNKKDKSQINLITSYILQRGGEGIWQNTIEDFKEIGGIELFETFLKDFLTLQSEGKLPNNNALYNKFRSYFSKISKYLETQKIIENICRYGQYYLKIYNADFENTEIKEQIVVLNSNNGRDAYPYLIEVMDDLENRHITSHVFLNILMMINSVVKNRKENPDSESQIDFTSLSKELNKMLVLKDYAPEATNEKKIRIS